MFDSPICSYVQTFRKNPQRLVIKQTINKKSKSSEKSWYLFFSTEIESKYSKPFELKAILLLSRGVDTNSCIESTDVFETIKNFVVAKRAIDANNLKRPRRRGASRTPQHRFPALVRHCRDTATAGGDGRLQPVLPVIGSSYIEWNIANPKFPQVQISWFIGMIPQSLSY